jgi:hypothetical protein
MKYHYAEEKLYQAVRCLVTGIGMLNQRLAGAAHYLTRLNPEHFPDLATSRKLQGRIWWCMSLDLEMTEKLMPRPRGCQSMTWIA